MKINEIYKIIWILFDENSSVEYRFFSFDCICSKQMTDILMIKSRKVKRKAKVLFKIFKNPNAKNN